MKYTYTPLESSLSLAMLEQTLKNQTIKKMLAETDLANSDYPLGCWSGKAQFFILLTEYRALTCLEKLQTNHVMDDPHYL
jgi:hypothetical protein